MYFQRKKAALFGGFERLISGNHVHKFVEVEFFPSFRETLDIEIYRCINDTHVI